MKRLITLLLIVGVFQAIVFGQKKNKYPPPQVQTPQSLDRDATTPQVNPQSLADLKWFEVFGDAKLQDLIREALVSNYDYRISREDRGSKSELRHSPFKSISYDRHQY